MTRDFSAFLPGATPPPPAGGLVTLGWSAHFAQQIEAEALQDTPPVRITQVHRSGMHAMGDGIDATLPPNADVTVGDWLLLDRDRPMDSVRLERKSLIQRRAPGHDRSIQLIAANIDTAFIVSSCNADFNVARLERYIALVLEAEITPVVLLTKSDLCDDIAPYLAQVETAAADIIALALDARGDDPAAMLAPWTGMGQTLAFLGSSGVGKSTLTNALIGGQIETQDIREDDARGRHTTTHRQLHRAPGGAIVLDTPGMRELQLTDVGGGIDALFSDLSEIAHRCKFNDCAHETEPGCAVRAALNAGAIDAARLERWRKLLAEDAHNTATLAERRKQDKEFGKMVNKAVRGKQARKGK